MSSAFRGKDRGAMNYYTKKSRPLTIARLFQKKIKDKPFLNILLKGLEVSFATL